MEKKFLIFVIVIIILFILCRSLVMYFVYSQPYGRINSINSKQYFKFQNYKKELEHNTFSEKFNIDERNKKKIISRLDRFHSTEEDNQYNLYQFQKDLEEKISHLRGYESKKLEEKKKNSNMSPKITIDEYKNNMKIINECYCKSFNYVLNYLELINIMEEINDRKTFYYRFMNENDLITIESIDSDKSSNPIKVFQVSKHHHAVEWIYKNYSNNLGTILHIDSHADMNPVTNDTRFIEKCISENKFEFDDLKRIYDSITTIGSVLVPMIAPYRKNNGIVWITPDWVKEPYCKSDNKVTTSKNGVMFEGLCPKNFPIKKIESLEKIYFDEEDRKFLMITSNIKDRAKILNDISNDYILNIDLDYFVTYGIDNYLPNGNDAISDYRTLFDYGYLLKTREERYDSKLIELNFEMNLIRRRIDEFLGLIIDLKNLGKIPKIIIICDSTRVNFSNDHLGMGFCTKNETELLNEFTPKYLTFWLHNTVLRNLNNIFTN